ncbi:uncharacterized protein LOC131683247 isoform X1 [Topomyia yanbarensis]|uniref:uncharacterized protein LOC131683247 isoform X1 n=1 Tax=Topomyia yanbarensis TaxID=2498891 RepID=UPI00273C5FAE|nr:uncharacterized protein LOC131683247 isoform X1 [Topomyia yanbarensis]
MRHNFVVIFQSSYFDLIYFSVCEYTKESFKTVAKDQLEADFLRAGYRCNIHELFQRIVSWRQSKGLNLFNFETVKFEHHWQDSQSDENVDTDRMPLDSLEVGESNSSGEGTKHQSVFPDSQITAEQSATNESTGFQLSGAHLPSQIFLSSVKLNSPFGEVSKIVPIILPSDLRRLQCSKLNALNAPTNVVCSEIESDELPLSRVDTQSLTEVLSTLRRLQQLGQTSSGVLEDQLKGSAVSVTETQTNLDQLNVFQKAHDDGSTETIFNFEFESSREHTAEQLQSKASNASGSTNIATGSKLPCVAQRTAEQLQSVILQEDQSTYAGSIRPHHEILVLEQKDNSELEHDTSVLEVSTPGISTNQLTASQYTEHVAEVSDFAEFFGPNKLRSLLEGTVTGKELINRAHQGPLSNQSQAELISILSEYHISTKGKVTEEILKIYTLAITLLFKHEKKVCYCFDYTTQPESNAKRFTLITGLFQYTLLASSCSEALLSKQEKQKFVPFYFGFLPEEKREDCDEKLATVIGYINHLMLFHRVPKEYHFICTYGTCIQKTTSWYIFKRHLYTHKPSNKFHVHHEAEESSQTIQPMLTTTSAAMLRTTANMITEQTSQLSRNLNHLQESSLSFTLDLHSSANLTRRDVRHIQKCVNNLNEKIAQDINELQLKITDPQIEFELHTYLTKMKSLFNFVGTDHKLFMYLTENNLFRMPTVVSLQREQISIHSKDITLEETYDESENNLVVMDVEFQIRSFFNTDNVLTQTIENTINLEQTEGITSIVSGNVWKQIKLKYKNDVQIPISLYADEFEINDPLGAHNKKHAVCGLYYSFPTIPDEFTSKLCNIFVCGAIKKRDISQAGVHSLLRHLVNVFKNVEETAFDFTNKGIIKPVRFIVTIFQGDNLGVHQFFGFLTFSANFYCRICRRHKDYLQTDCEEINDCLRNEDNYDSDVALNNPSETGIKH